MRYDTWLNIRTYKTHLSNFRTWCKKTGEKPQDFLRKVMIAAPEGRVQIKLTDEEKKLKKELYK